MISDRLFRCVGIVFPIMGFLGVIPYTWDKKTRTMIPSSHSKFYMRIHFLHICSGLLISILQNWYLFNTKDFGNFNLSFNSALCLLLTLQMWTVMVIYPDDYLQMVNAVMFVLVYINREFMPSYDPNTSRFSRWAEYFLYGITACGFCVAFLTEIGICLYPHSAMFLAYWVPEDAPLPIRVTFCYIMPGVYIPLICFNVCIIVTAFVAYDLFIVPFAIHEFRMGSTSYKTIPKLRQPETLILAYRTIQLLQQQINALLGVLLVPVQAIMTEQVVFTGFMLIRYSQIMDNIFITVLSIWAAFAGAFWVAVLITGGSLHFYGNKVLLSWKYHSWSSRHNTKLMNKFRRSCQPLMFKFGKAYVIRRLSVLKFIRGVSRGILRALLAL